MHICPFFRITIPFVIGIIIGWITLSYTAAILFAISGLIVWILGILCEHKEIYNNRHIKGIALSLLLTASGTAVYNASLPTELAGIKQVSSYQIYKLNKNATPSAIEVNALQIRESLIGIYRKYISNDNVGIISALTLGKKDDLSRDTRQIFSLAGGSHVLAVSGLHVGIIYAIILGLLSFIPHSQIGNITRHSIVILCLWFYAFICGLPASVVRSAFMFSLISGSYILGKSNYSLNSVFVSMFFMLLYNPLYLFDIGFQLSYAAVISILIFYPKLYSILHFQNKIMIWVWGMICVSAAAQIGTLPLTVYYFHQIPVYSILTNFVVVPAAFIIIYVALALLVFSFIPPVAMLIGRLADVITEMLCNGVAGIVNLPYSVISDIHIDFYIVLLMFAIIFTAYYIINSAKIRNFVG
ncbi:MAG: ComEC/Rec2 family competence protein [Paludibacteraceae bacterium]|nr:ComEC/Rec2 family competence protein [Paludibacteraceae bacterium]